MENENERKESATPAPCDEFGETLAEAIDMALSLKKHMYDGLVMRHEMYAKYHESLRRVEELSMPRLESLLHFYSILPSGTWRTYGWFADLELFCCGGRQRRCTVSWVSDDYIGFEWYPSKEEGISPQMLFPIHMFTEESEEKARRMMLQAAVEAANMRINMYYASLCTERTSRNMLEEILYGKPSDLSK